MAANPTMTLTMDDIGTIFSILVGLDPEKYVADDVKAMIYRARALQEATKHSDGAFSVRIVGERTF